MNSVKLDFQSKQTITNNDVEHFINIQLVVVHLLDIINSNLGTKVQVTEVTVKCTKVNISIDSLP